MGEAEGRRKTRKAGGGGQGWGICCHGERFSKQLLICLCSSAPPFPFFSSFPPTPPLSLSLALSHPLSLRPSVRPSASHSGRRFAPCAFGSGPSCSRASTPSATRRDGRACPLNTRSGSWRVRKTLFHYFHAAAVCVCLCVSVWICSPPHPHVCPSLAPRQRLCIITDEPKPPRST